MRQIVSTACLLLLIWLLSGCVGSPEQKPIVIWVTGGLHGDFLPHGDYGVPQAGGLSRIARALELYRQPGDLLVDLGQFRYPVGVSGETRRWRIKANGFLKAMTRLKYDAINVSSLDLPPWPPELAQRAREYDLPIISGNVISDSLLFASEQVIHRGIAAIRFEGMTHNRGEFGHWAVEASRSSRQLDIENGLTILLTDASEEAIRAYGGQYENLDLVLWLNQGKPLVKEIAGVAVLGMGDEGTCLGRIEISGAGRGPRWEQREVTGWLDGRAYRHHPAREAFWSKFKFWRKKLDLRAYLWQVPEELSPEKHAEAQRKQTAEEADRYSQLEEINRQTPTEFAGSNRCLDCHSLDHLHDLAKRHLRDPQPQVQDYPIYERCLSCHATGFDDPAGFLLPWERPDLLQVGCEACHSGSYSHALQGEQPYPPKPEEEVCRGCHSAAAWPAGHPAKLGQ